MIYAKTARHKYISVLHSIPEEPSSFMVLRQHFMYHYEFTLPIPQCMRFVASEPALKYDFDKVGVNASPNK